MDSQAPSPAPRRVVLLGATGSIGRQAVDVIARFPDRFEVVGVVAGRNLAGLRALAERFGTARVAVVAPDPGAEVPHGWGIGLEAACELAAMPADVVCVAITGAAALRPTLAAIDAGTTVATATKEVLVMAGEIVRARSRRSGARIVAIDSEHSAIWQCLRGEDPASVSRLILTASGGPFRERDPATFRKLKRVAMMGGSIYRGYDDGKTGEHRPPDSEWNINRNPAGAKALLASGVPIFMMPLDSTQIHLQQAEREAIFSHGSPLTDQLTLLYHQWMTGSGGQVLTPTLFDPVAVTYAIRPELCPAKPMRVEVDEKGFTRPAAGAPNAQVCLQSDEKGFLDLLRTRIVGDATP